MKTEFEFFEKKLYSLDEASVTDLVERYRAPLVYFATGYLGDIAAAEDVVSDAVVRLLVKKPRLHDEAALKSYLYTSTKRAAIDFLRKSKREKNHKENVIRLAETEILYIDERIGTSERRRILLGALRALDSEYREVLHLRYFEELSVEEIAKIVKGNKKQIYNRLARAKGALKSILEKEGVCDEIEF